MMKLRRLGMTGVEVSELCLGAMNFGMPDWGIQEEKSIEIIRAYLEAGGNFIDTADVYGGGASEEICAKVLQGRRSEIILATKGHFPVTRRFDEPPAHANARGSSRVHLTKALHDSLKRLKTDYVDLYQVHCWDDVTPIEETLGTLDRFVQAGMVRYVGLSNFAAWQIAETRQMCIRCGWEPFVTAQMQFSLVCRDIENDVIPVCQRYGIGLLPWSPLGGGVLSGKYARDLTGPAGARHGQKPDPKNSWRDRFVNKRNIDIAETVKAVALELDTSPVAVAIAWTLRSAAVSSVILGPRSIEQLHENLSACDIELTDEQWHRLDDVSAPVQPYPEWFIADNPRNAPSHE